MTTPDLIDRAEVLLLLNTMMAESCASASEHRLLVMARDKIRAIPQAEPTPQTQDQET